MLHKLILPTLFALQVFLNTGCGEKNKATAKFSVYHPDVINASRFQNTNLGTDYLRSLFYAQKKTEDSLRKTEILNSILIQITNLKNDNQKITSFDFYPSDSIYCQKVNYAFGNLFSKNKKHLILERASLVDFNIYLNVFLFENDTFKLVCTEEWCDLNYQNYSIQDINGDAKKDFVVKWWPTAGCCPRDCYVVFLYDTNGHFSSPFEFMNPEFSAKEKVVRGMGYGLPGEVELYKFRWNGYDLDTVEFIFPNPTDSTFKTFIRKTKNYSDSSHREIIKKVPSEYLKVKEYDWFQSY